MIVKIGDYVDGLLSGEDKAAVEQKIASDPAWKETHDELAEARVEARKGLSGLQKARAPGHFAKDVTETIKKRSGGRFFGRNDRFLLPVMILAMLALVAIAYVMWSSQTGSLKP
ncbi:MAG: hypothetical protein JO257_11260 [Deltaproteobacteria bacterium]|nr:hypothetical protein [Deltaproteobacteria bacterium]